MGPFRAKQIGLSTQDFVDIVYDGDIVQYVAKYTPFLLNLTVHGREEGEKKYVLKYQDNRDSILNGAVIEYSPSNPPTQPKSEAYIYLDKWTFLKDYMNKWQLIDFLNHYYDLNIEELYGGGD